MGREIPSDEIALPDKTMNTAEISSPEILFVKIFNW
jgi:hypothetical protein